MLLICKAQISDWSSSCPVRQRAKETQLSFLKRSNETFLCLIAKADKSQCLFKVTGHNILQLFTKFLEDGKLTVRFNDPRRDVCLSNLSCAAAGNLTALLKRFSRGKDIPERVLHPLRNSPSLHAQPSCRKMVITERANYPLGKPFEKTLVELHATGLSLRAFDDRISRLHHLKFLSLNGNRLTIVPNTIECLGLTSLLLRDNLIVLWPSISENSPLAGSLRSLDLANNQIVWLPEDFWNLVNLTNLDISNNRLRGLPAANLHLRSGLLNMDLNRNQMSCLPHAFSRLGRLMRVVLDGNPWHPPTLDLETGHSPQSPDSLLHSASDAFIRHFHKALPFLQQLPIPLALRLAILRNCRICGRPCGFLPMRFLRKFTPSCLERVVDAAGPTIISYCCSPACLHRLKTHPFRYL